MPLGARNRGCVFIAGLVRIGSEQRSRRQTEKECWKCDLHARFFPRLCGKGKPAKEADWASKELLCHTSFLLCCSRASHLNSRVRRELLKNITRIVVKLGTGVLTDSRKQIDPAQMEQLVAQVAQQRKTGREVVLVSSGAVGAGMGVLGYEKRPGQLAEMQACAAVGQSRLMASYGQLFATYDLPVAQVLLTHDDLQHHERHLNARNTLV